MPDGEFSTERWRGKIDERLDDIEEKLDRFIEEMRTWRHTTNNTIQSMLLADERNKGRIEGSKAVLVLIGGLVGTAITAAAAWLSKKI